MSTKILLADDSVTIQKVVELTFSDGDYEVVTTNNGAEAIEAIGSSPPDLILSDIIMPEKNGYELCEFVKSHPEHKSIPVILLTGTFEPFDPERAEKAGCDAVVTKPFESQSLIQKVEELLKGGSDPEAASPAETIPAGMSSPFAGEEEDTEEEAATSEPALEEQEEPPAPQGDVFDSEVPESDEESSTRMIPKMSLEDLQKAQQEQAEGEGDTETADDTAADAATREAPGATPPPPPAAQEAGSAPFHQQETPPPFGAPPAEPTGSLAGEDEPSEDDATRMIPKMSLEDLQKAQQEQPEANEEPDRAAAGEAYEPESSTGEEPSPPASAEEAPAFGSGPTTEAAEEASAVSEEEEPFGTTEPETTDEDSSTRLIPKMSLEDLQKMQQEQADANEEPVQMAESQEEEPRLASEAPSPAETERPPEESEQPDISPPPFGGTEPQTGAPDGDVEEEWSPATSKPEASEPWGAPAIGGGPSGGEDEDALVERVAQRVIEKLSEKAIREIAWDVIPETAERVVRERVKELESSQD